MLTISHIPGLDPEVIYFQWTSSRKLKATTGTRRILPGWRSEKDVRETVCKTPLRRGFLFCASEISVHGFSTSLVGAGLLAIQTPRCFSVPAVMQSRASPAPHLHSGILWVHHILKQCAQQPQRRLLPLYIAAYQSHLQRHPRFTQGFPQQRLVVVFMARAPR